jgi:signal transduction histidine kinase
MLRAGRHLLELIDDVLNLARIESGHVQLSLDCISLADLVDNCLGLLMPLAQRRGITVQVQGLHGQHLRADRVRLRQVIINLLSNAIKYNVEGGRIEISAARKVSGRVRLAVRDSGPGIAPERQHELFQPFSRLGAERGSVEGTGIGLVIVRQLVELMAGQVGVHSAPGHGSLFWVELPADDSGDGQSTGARPERPCVAATDVANARSAGCASCGSATPDGR